LAPLLMKTLTSSDLGVRRAGEVGGAERCRLTAVGGVRMRRVVVVVLVVRRGHPHGAPPQLLQLRQPLGERQGAGFDFIHLLPVAWRDDESLKYHRVISTHTYMKGFTCLEYL